MQPTVRATAVLLLALAGCPATSGSGKAKQETRAAGTFDEIHVSGAFELDVRVGAPTAVRITGDDNLLPYVRTEVRGRSLHIDTTRRVRPRVGLKATVHTPALVVLNSSGSAEGRVVGLHGASFRLEVSGSAKVALEGKVQRFRSSISGSANVQAAKLRADAVSLDVSGSADATVFAGKTLDVDVSGSARVHYLGRPRVRKRVSGSATVVAR